MRFIAVLAITLAATLTVGEAGAQPGVHAAPQSTYSVDPPPLRAGRVASQIALGAVTGLVGTVPGGVAGLFIADRTTDCNDDACAIGSAVLGGYVGYSLSAPVGVYWAGDQRASFGATMLGGAVGGGLGALALIGLAESNISSGTAVGLAYLIAFGAAPVGATIGYNMTRRSDRQPAPSRVGSLLMIDSSGTRLGVPVPAIGLATGGASLQLSLLSGAL